VSWRVVFRIGGRLRSPDASWDGAAWRVVFRIGGRLRSPDASWDGAVGEIPPTARCGTNPADSGRQC